MLNFTVNIILVVIIFTANVEIALASMCRACKSITIISDNVIRLEATDLGKLSRRELHAGVHALAKVLPDNTCCIIYVIFLHDLASAANLIAQVPLHVSNLLLIVIIIFIFSIDIIVKIL